MTCTCVMAVWAPEFHIVTQMSTFFAPTEDCMNTKVPVMVVDMHMGLQKTSSVYENQRNMC